MNNLGRISSRGFSAAELLITLFIASLFLISGYQLYTYVVRDGAEASQVSKASNIAYQYLRQVAADENYIKDECSTATQPGSQSLNPNTGLNNASVNVVISCPHNDNDDLEGVHLLTATVTYASSNGNETVSHAMTAAKPVVIAGGGGTNNHMQTVTTANCPTTRTMKVDARDNRTYWVQKLGDGKCWMLTNLAYAGGGTNTYSDTRTLTNGTGGATSYTVASYYVPTGANPTTNPTQPSTSTNGTGQYGYFYNWCAAMGAQTSTSACANATTPAPNVNTSICPAGWRLPTGNGGEFGALNTAVNGGSTSTDAGLLSGWLAQRGGYWSSGFSYQGSYGYYWSSTQNSATYGYGLGFSSTLVNPASYGYKGGGFAVRCVAN